ncbi:MAG: carboxypeptidase regulatory-like domain-containing protein [Saprospiraceae bacterium]|nr:carboxypeptidase regulatory-like domain-containing protein [Saprospiraceae bacterium]
MRTLIGLYFIVYWMSGFSQSAAYSGGDFVTNAIDPASPLVKEVKIMVKDMKSKEVIPFFTIDFSSCGHPVYESNGEGIFSMETVKGFACFIRIAKRGYANLDLMVDYDEINGDSKTYNVFLSRSPNCFSGYVKDTVGGNLYLANAKLELRAKQNNYVQRAETDKKGEFSLYLTPDTDYELRIIHEDYHPFDYNFSTGDELDGHELKYLFVNRIDHKKIPGGLGTEVGVTRKDKRIDGINYYSIQIMAKHNMDVDLDVFKDLEPYGEVFIEKDGLVSKVKVGKFFDRSVAEKTLSKIRSKPAYEDAFLTQYLAGNKNHATRDRRIETREEGFMVRLASYLNPEMFDGKKVESLGKITSVQKNEWTIMLLSGFDDLDDAKDAAEKVKDLGFRSAYVVQYVGSKLEKIN